MPDTIETCCGCMSFASQPVEQQVLGGFAKRASEIGVADTENPRNLATRLARMIPLDGATNTQDLQAALDDVTGLTRKAASRVDSPGDEFLARSMFAAHVLGMLRIQQKAERQVIKASAQHQKIMKFAVDDVSFLTTPITPARAFSWINDRIPMTRAKFDSLQQHYDRQTFFVSRVNNASAVGRIQKELEKIIRGEDPDSPSFARPVTRQKFAARMNDVLDLTGNTRLDPWHAELVYHQATAGAFNAGVWEAIEENADQIEFVIYKTFDDRRVRGRPGGLYPDAEPSHWDLHDFTAPPNDPIWTKIAPPNGFNCRCYTETIFKDDPEAKGKKSTTGAKEKFVRDFDPDEEFRTKPSVERDARIQPALQRKIVDAGRPIPPKPRSPQQRAQDAKRQEVVASGPTDLNSFATEVQALARANTAGRFGPRDVFIDPVRKDFLAANPGFDASRFNDLLVQARNRNLIKARSVDIIPPNLRALAKASEIQVGTAAVGRNTIDLITF